MPISFLLGLLGVAIATGGLGRAPEPSELSRSSEYEDAFAGAAKMARAAMDALKENGVPGLMGEAHSGRKGCWKEADRFRAEATIGKLHDLMVSRQGKPIGEIEFVRRDVVGRSLARFMYVEKLERGAVLWTLKFYRGEGDVWMWHNINVTNERFNGEFRTAQREPKHEGAAALAQQAIAELKKGGTTRFLDVVFEEGKTVVNGERNVAELAIADFYEKASDKLGEPLGKYEFLGVETLGESIVRFVYIEKFAEGAAVWKLSFYSARGGWKWQNVDFNVW